MTDESGKGESSGKTREDSVLTATETRRTFEWSGVVPEGVVCPACCGELRTGSETLACVACGRSYPVIDGIPVLIVERAEQG
jgi:hypothetical protein